MLKSSLFLGRGKGRGQPGAPLAVCDWVRDCTCQTLTVPIQDSGTRKVALGGSLKGQENAQARWRPRSGNYGRILLLDLTVDSNGTSVPMGKRLTPSQHRG